MPRTYEPRPWPYLARAARDSAAEEVAAALNGLTALFEVEDDAAKIKELGRSICKLQNALRHLESVGACTRPSAPY